MSRTGRDFAIVMLAMVLAAPAAHALATIGARVGVCVASASLDVEQTFDEENRTGFAGTIFLNSGAAGLLDLQAEASYIQKGLEDGVTGLKIELDYVELALLAKAGLPIPAITPHVFGGVGYDIVVDEQISGDLFEASNSDWSLIFGADISFKFGSNSLWVDGRYSMGLTEVNEASDVVSDVKNQAWIFSAGLGHSF